MSLCYGAGTFRKAELALGSVGGPQSPTFGTLMYRRLAASAFAFTLASSVLIGSAPAAAQPPHSHTNAATAALAPHDQLFPNKSGMRLVVPASATPTPSAQTAPHPAATVHAQPPTPTRRQTSIAAPRHHSTPARQPAPVSYSSAQSYAQSVLGSTQYVCLSNIISRESGWDPYATNPSSGAYGLVQALPGSKMASAGSDWRTNPITQIRWGISYMDSTYGSPCGAWSWWTGHGWY